MHFNDIELTTETYDDVALGAYVAGRRLTHDGIEASPSGLKARLDVVGGACPGERGSSVRAGHLLPEWMAAGAEKVTVIFQQFLQAGAGYID